MIITFNFIICFFRQPFEGQERYDNIKKILVELSIHLATIGQRDKFAENQASIILHICEKLVTESDMIIQVRLYLMKNSAECGEKCWSAVVIYCW